tara:strand:+ start:1797 stop:2135 length:339 start_codon:yes stop_codon:yes gene_type:complete
VLVQSLAVPHVHGEGGDMKKYRNLTTLRASVFVQTIGFGLLLFFDASNMNLFLYYFGTATVSAIWHGNLIMGYVYANLPESDFLPDDDPDGPDRDSKDPNDSGSFSLQKNKS